MPVTVYTPSPALTTGNNNPDLNFRQLVQLSARSNGQLRASFKADPGGGLQIDGASFGKWDGIALSTSSVDMTTTPFRLTFNGGSNTTLISAGLTQTSDFVAHPGLTLNAGDWVIVSWKSGTSGNEIYSTGHSTAVVWFKAGGGGTDYSQCQTASGSLPNGAGGGWSNSGDPQPGNANGRNFSVVLVETSDAVARPLLRPKLWLKPYRAGHIQPASIATRVDYAIIAEPGIVGLAGQAATLTYTTLLASPQFRSHNSTDYSSRTSTVIPAPDGIVDGDVLLLTHLVGGASPTSQTLPAGFTLIDSTTVRDNSDAFSVITKVAWKRAASESGSYTITHGLDNSQGAIAVYSGCIASGSPVDVYSKASMTRPISFNDSITATAPSITTTVTYTRLFYTGHDWWGVGTLSPPTGFVERFDSLIYNADAEQVAAGATGTVGHDTGDTGPAYNAPWAAFLIALKPAAGIAPGAPYTLTAGTGTLALSGQEMTPRVAMPVVNGTLTAAGQAVALRVTRKMVAATGTLTLAGQTMTPRVAMPIVNGTLTFAGQTVTLRYGHKAPAGVGVLTMGGQPVTLKRTYVMPAGIGTLTFAGQASFLRYTRLKLTALAGTLTLSGQALVPRATRKMAALTGTLTLSGWPTTHRWTHVIPVGTGTLTLSGRPINLTYSASGSKVLLATPGILAAAGQPVTLRYKRVMPAGTGALALSGQTVALRAARRMALLQGTLTLSGQIVVTRYGHRTVAGLGTLTAAGQTVALRIGRRLVALNGTLTLAGRPVNLDYLGKVHYLMSLSPGSVAMSGQPVILRRARVMPVAAGALTMAGQSIGFKYGHALAAETGGLNLSGQTVTLFWQQRFIYGLTAEPGVLTLHGPDAGLGYAPIAPEVPPQILVHPVPRVRALTGNQRTRELKSPYPHARELVSKDGRWRTPANDGRRIRVLNSLERT